MGWIGLLASAGGLSARLKRMNKYNGLACFYITDHRFLAKAGTRKWLGSVLVKKATVVRWVTTQRTIRLIV